VDRYASVHDFQSVFDIKITIAGPNPHQRPESSEAKTRASSAAKARTLSSGKVLPSLREKGWVALVSIGEFLVLNRCLHMVSYTIL